MKLQKLTQRGRAYFVVPALAIVVVAGIGTTLLKINNAQAITCRTLYYAQGTNGSTVTSNNHTIRTGSATICADYVQKILNGLYAASQDPTISSTYKNYTGFAPYANSKYGTGLTYIQTTAQGSGQDKIGVFGANTTARVKAFQTYFAGMAVDGRVDAATWKALCGVGLHMPNPDAAHYWEEEALGAARHSGCASESIPALHTQGTTTPTVSESTVNTIPAIPANFRHSSRSTKMNSPTTQAQVAKAFGKRILSPMPPNS